MLGGFVVRTTKRERDTVVFGLHKTPASEGSENEREEKVDEMRRR